MPYISFLTKEEVGHRGFPHDPWTKLTLILWGTVLDPSFPHFKSKKILKSAPPPLPSANVPHGRRTTLDQLDCG